MRCNIKFYNINGEIIEIDNPDCNKILENINMSNSNLNSMTKSNNWKHFVNLSNNIISSLPESIGDLNNLTSLQLQNNKLTLLPESIGNLNNLTSLQLQNNKLTTLPLTLTKLNKLSFISLNDNDKLDIPELVKKFLNKA
jgi:Leucine-rich repeat (LRR) protein